MVRYAELARYRAVRDELGDRRAPRSHLGDARQRATGKYVVHALDKKSLDCRFLIEGKLLQLT
jgi:hypothetical protein